MLKVSKSAVLTALPLLSPFVLSLSALAQSTERVSVTSSESQVFRDSIDADIDADGDFVVFESRARFTNDNNDVADVFRRNLLVGITRRLSISSDEKGGNLQSGNPSISRSGRFVAFESLADTLVPGDENGNSDVFVRDIRNGLTERVSTGPGGIEGNLPSHNPDLSGDGGYVAFQSFATNLVPNDTNGSCPDIFVHNRATGVTEMVSVSSTGTQGQGGCSDRPSISSNGRYVAFDSLASGLVPGDTNDAFDVFVHDRSTGITERVSVSSTGDQGNRASSEPAISADGRYVAFSSTATNLVSGDTNGQTDVFVHDRVTGVTELVSVSSAGIQGNGSSSEKLSITPDGRYVAFMSGAKNLVAGDTNECRDIFVHDRSTGATELISVSSTGEQGNDCSDHPAMSADGCHVVFESNSSNLVAGDTNNRKDVFVRHLCS